MYTPHPKSKWLSIAGITCFELSVSGDDRKSGKATRVISDERNQGRAGSSRENSPFSLPEPARRPPTFSIVPTDREPGTPNRLREEGPKLAYC